MHFLPCIDDCEVNSITVKSQEQSHKLFEIAFAISVLCCFGCYYINMQIMLLTNNGGSSCWFTFVILEVFSSTNIYPQQVKTELFWPPLHHFFTSTLLCKFCKHSSSFIPPFSCATGQCHIASYLTMSLISLPNRWGLNLRYTVGGFIPFKFQSMYACIYLVDHHNALPDDVSQEKLSQFYFFAG